MEVEKIRYVGIFGKERPKNGLKKQKHKIRQSNLEDHMSVQS